MKIVIISQVLYPTISPRGYRAMELAKQFAKRGNDVSLYGLLGKYNYTDIERSTNVKIKNIGRPLLGGLLTDSDGNRKVNFMYKVINKLFERLFAYPGICVLHKTYCAIKQEPNTDLLITTGWPFHWGAAYAKMKMKKKFPIVWVSDCGDPFMGNPYAKYPFYFKYVELWWGKKTDYVCIPIEAARRAYYKNVQNKIVVIPQGVDFSNMKTADYIPNKVLTFGYAGVFYPGKRDPSAFLQYLTTLKFDFTFIIHTNNDSLLIKYKKILGDKLKIYKFIDRSKLIWEFSLCDFIINIKNEGSNVQSPSKLIDYALMRRPILQISSIFGQDEIAAFNDFAQGKYSKQYIVENVEQYDIKNVVDKFLFYYDLLINSKNINENN